MKLKISETTKKSVELRQGHVYKGKKTGRYFIYDDRESFVCLDNGSSCWMVGEDLVDDANLNLVIEVVDDG